MANNFALSKPQKQKAGYFIELKSNDPELAAAGFDACLAIATLDLPLDIFVENESLVKKCASLKDFELAHVYRRSELNELDYQALKKKAHFFLAF